MQSTSWVCDPVSAKKKGGKQRRRIVIIETDPVLEAFHG
jgi:hypothetical protein